MFKSNKYGKWYIAIIRKALSENREKKSGVYYESHHIIPRCMGGKQTILLTAKEHFICHLLLPFFTRNENRFKMINGIVAMKQQSDGQKRYTSKNYELIRKLIAEKNSYIFKGKPKPVGHGEKVSKARKGMKFSLEHRQNISKSQIGKMSGDLNISKRIDVRKKISEKKKLLDLNPTQNVLDGRKRMKETLKIKNGIQME